jgi:hypothetical protein
MQLYSDCLRVASDMQTDPFLRNMLSRLSDVMVHEDRIWKQSVQESRDLK